MDTKGLNTTSLGILYYVQKGWVTCANQPVPVPVTVVHDDYVIKAHLGIQTSKKKKLSTRLRHLSWYEMMYGVLGVCYAAYLAFVK